MILIIIFGHTLIHFGRLEVKTMLSEKEVQKICYDELCKLNLGSGCDDFINTLVSGNTKSASLKLQNIILLSISRCVKAALDADSKK
jgi:hypothetical protein